MIAAVSRPPVDWFSISPSLILLIAAGACLMVAVLVPQAARRAAAAATAAAGFVGAFVAAVLLYDRTPIGISVYEDTVRRDRFFALAAIILALVGLVAVLVSYTEHRHGHVAEYYALLATAAAGMMFLTQANSLLTLFLGLEWFSISLYILCAIDYRRERSLEAGLKYLIVGGFGSAVLLFGSALVYGATGKLTFDGIAEAVTAGGLSGDALLLTGLAMIIVGLGFKASAAPFHMWTPDVYEGAPTSVTAFMAAATKVAALLLTFRILVTAFPQEDDLWTVALAVIAVCSLVLGNFAALVQKNLKRLLAYSSISNAGFMLIAVSANSALGGRALLYYLIPYAAASIGAFAVVAARERELGHDVTIDDLAGMGWERPLLGASMWTFMLELRRPAADRRLPRQVLRLLRGVRPRLALARDRRRARDRGQPLLLPQRDPGAIPAPERRAPVRRRRPAPARLAAPGGDGRVRRRRRRLVLRGAAADRPRDEGRRLALGPGGAPAAY